MLTKQHAQLPTVQDFETNEKIRYTTKSQFLPFSQLIDQDETITRKFNDICNSQDQLKLINYKLNNNKLKATSYMNQIYENASLKKNYYDNIMYDFNKKLEFAEINLHNCRKKNCCAAVKVMPKPQFANNSPLKNNTTKHLMSKIGKSMIPGSQGKEADNGSSGGASDFNSLLKKLEVCYSYPIDKNVLKPDSREGCSLTTITLKGKKYGLLHGGMSGNIYGDLYLFEVGKFHWKFVSALEGIFDPKFGHTCNSIGTKVYIFGGQKAFGPKHNSYSEDVTIIDFAD